MFHHIYSLQRLTKDMYGTTVCSKYHEEAYDVYILRAFVLFSGKFLR